MSADELAGYLAQGLREAECYELDCDRCGVVRVIGLDRPDVCPICGITGDVWHRRCLILTRSPLPLFNVVRGPAPMHQSYAERPYDQTYAAILEGRYGLPL